MSLILNIDTSGPKASLCLSRNGESLQLLINDDQQDHAAWIHKAIQTLTEANTVRLTDLQAVATTIGPGSYTGLRVGLSTAKGLCFALNIPLIAISTLEVMAFAAKGLATDFICPLIDARRMEVFTALYDAQMNLILNPHALIIDQNSFADVLSSHHILFLGSGLTKLREQVNHPNAVYRHLEVTAAELGALSIDYFLNSRFANLAYTEPLYIKEFYFPARKPSA